MDSKWDVASSISHSESEVIEELQRQTNASEQLSHDLCSKAETHISFDSDVHQTPLLQAVDSAARVSIDSHNSEQILLSISSSRPESCVINQNGSIPGTSLEPQFSMQNEALVDQMRSAYEAAELRRQEDTHRYLEHVDALQAKLQYLTKEVTEVAKKTKTDARAGSIEQKLAIKDEKIALLMEEGQKLSQIELKHMNTIKRLRARIAEDEKSREQSLETIGELEKAARSAEKRAEAAAHFLQENRQETLQGMESQLERAKVENATMAIEIADLRQQLASARKLSEETEVKELKKTLRAQVKIVSELRDDLTNAKLERELVDERHRAYVHELEEKFNGGNERAKATEMELRTEINVSHVAMLVSSSMMNG